MSSIKIPFDFKPKYNDKNDKYICRPKERYYQILHFLRNYVKEKK